MNPAVHINHNRPEKTARTLEPLSACNPLYLFCDGPSLHAEKTMEVQEILRETKRERDAKGLETHLLILEENKGPAQGPLTAIRWFFEHNASGHVIEDDILVHPSFFPIHRNLLDRYQEAPHLWIGAGFPLPTSAPFLSTQTTQLVAWSSWKTKIDRILTTPETPTPWDRTGTRLLKNLHPKTQAFLWKEFRRLQKNPDWSWDYLWLQFQLELGVPGITPTSRIHTNLGLDGSGHNHQILFNRQETWGNLEKLTNSNFDICTSRKWERRMEWGRYGRVTQSVARKLWRITPPRLRFLWQPCKA